MKIEIIKTLGNHRRVLEHVNLHEESLEIVVLNKNFTIRETEHGILITKIGGMSIIPQGNGGIHIT